MEDLSLLGNAAAVPIIVAITQYLKRNFSFKYKAEVVALAVSIVVSLGWSFYNTPAAQLEAAVASGWIPMFKGLFRELIIAGATWLSATKSYDMFLGEKKRTTRHDEEKRVLKERIAELESTEEHSNADAEMDQDLSARLRQILEG